MTRKRLIGLSVARGKFTLFAHVLEGVARYAQRRPDWTFVPVPEECTLPSRRARHQLDGLLARVDTPEFSRRLQRCHWPVVDIGLELPDLPFPSVRVDNLAVGRMAFEHLRERGLQAFAFVGVSPGLFSTLREEAFGNSVRSAGFELSIYRIRFRIPAEFDPPTWPSEPQMLDWLRNLPKPVGLFVPWDMVGFQVIEACRLLGLAVPDEIAILSTDNDELTCRLAKPALSSIILPTEQIGYEAARLLDSLMEGRQPQRLQILLSPCGIETRQSTDILATDDALVAAAIRFVRENAHRPVHIGDVLRVVPLGRRTLEQRVRRFLGHSLGQEILKVHLERAQKLLVTTDMPIKEVALHSGFVNGRHLAVVFRRALGQPATRFRAAARNRTATDSADRIQRRRIRVAARLEHVR